MQRDKKRENDRRRERGKATERDKDGKHTFSFVLTADVCTLGIKQEGR